MEHNISTGSNVSDTLCIIYGEGRRAVSSSSTRVHAVVKDSHARHGARREKTGGSKDEIGRRTPRNVLDCPLQNYYKQGLFQTFSLKREGAFETSEWFIDRSID